jgi:DNA modification methylase
MPKPCVDVNHCDSFDVSDYEGPHELSQLIAFMQKSGFPRHSDIVLVCPDGKLKMMGELIEYLETHYRYICHANINDSNATVLVGKTIH